MFVQSENALLNRNVFRCFLNKLRQYLARMASGRLFQKRGAALEKPLSPWVWTLLSDLWLERNYFWLMACSSRMSVLPGCIFKLFLGCSFHMFLAPVWVFCPHARQRQVLVNFLRIPVPLPHRSPSFPVNHSQAREASVWDDLFYILTNLFPVSC